MFANRPTRGLYGMAEAGNTILNPKSVTVMNTKALNP